MVYRVILILTLAPYAVSQAAENDLLWNTEFEPSAGKTGEFKAWEVEPGVWTRKSRELADDDELLEEETFTIEGRRGEWVVQRGVEVKPNKWYAISAWYIADLDVRRGGNFHMFATDPRKGGLRLKGGVCEGPVKEWTRAAGYFHSGDCARMDFHVRFVGRGRRGLGRCAVAEVEEPGFTPPMLTLTADRTLPRKTSGNLILNPEFRLAPRSTAVYPHWHCTPGWRRKLRTDHTGAELPYLTKQDAGQIEQKDVLVDSETWYILKTSYRGDLKLRLYAKTPEQSEPLPVQRVFGPSSDWTTVKTFVCTIGCTSLKVGAQFEGEGACALGTFELVKVSDDDWKSSFFADGGFERGIAGQPPVDFDVFPFPGVVATDGQFPEGKKSLKFSIGKDSKLYFRWGRRIPARRGDNITCSFWARASRPGITLTPLINYASGWVFGRAEAIGTEWQRIELKPIACAPSGPHVNHWGDVQFLNLQCGIHSGPKAEVWFDNIAVAVEPRHLERPGVRARGRNLVVNSSFEGGLEGWSYGFARYLWQRDLRRSVGTGSIDMTTAVEGTCSLRLESPEPAEPDDKVVAQRSFADLCSVYFPGKLRDRFTISFWAKADKPTRIEARLTPRSVIVGGGSVGVGTEWRRYSITSDIAIPGEKGDPAAAAKFEYQYAGYLALGLRFHGCNTCWLDGIQVEEGELTDYEPPGSIEVGGVCDRTYPWYRAGETPTATLYLCSRLKQESPLRLNYEMTDWKGNTVARGEQTVVVPGGRTIRQKQALFANKTGTFICHLTLVDPATNAKAESDIIYGIFPPTRDLDPDKSWFGLDADGISVWGRMLLKGGSAREFTELLRMTGARWMRSWRLSMWSFIEPKSGELQWFDDWLDMTRGEGFKVMSVLGYNINTMPGWAASDRAVSPKPGVPEGSMFYPKMEFWERYLQSFSQHYQGRIDAFEVLNETGRFDPPEYLEYLEVAYRLLKKQSPSCPVVAPAYPVTRFPTGPDDASWIGQVCKRGLFGHIDVYSGHLYPPNISSAEQSAAFGVARAVEEAQTDKADAARLRWTKKTYGDKPVWDTESAQGGGGQLRWMFNPFYFGARKNCPARSQADRWARWSILKMAMGVERTFCHGFRNGPLNASFSVSGMECNGAPRPLAVAYAQLARRLDGFRYLGGQEHGRSMRTHFFEVEGKPVAVYWDWQAKDVGQLLLSVPVDKIKAEDLMGNELDLRTENGHTVLPLDRSPVFVLGNGIGSEELMAGFAKGDQRRSEGDRP